MINNKTRRTLLRLAGLAFVVAISLQWSGAQTRLALLSSVFKLPTGFTLPSGSSPRVPLPFFTPTPVPKPTATPTPTATPVPSSIGTRASSITVVNLNDSGAGSLRQAILDANNATAGGLPVTIAFNIPRALMANNVFTISPLSALPALTNNQMIVDGNTQTTNVGDTNALGPEVVVKGTSAGAASNGLSITGSNVTIRGLVINSFGADGINVRGAGTDIIRNCYIGLDETGTTAAANGGDGIDVGAPDVTIGGVTGAGNVISGNTANGVLVSGTSATQCSLGSNSIGTNALGTAAVANGGDGVAFAAGAADGVVGNSSRARNLISGNTGNGVSVSGAGTDRTIITSNYIGVDASVDIAVSNQKRGVLVQLGAAATDIGTASNPNVISGNNSDGVAILDAATTGTDIVGNMIGVDDVNNNGIGNNGSGVLVNGANSTLIGGVSAGNVLRFNEFDGVRIQAGNGNEITGNTISDNTRLGINLVGGTEDSFGTTANDLGDSDTGANGLQNAPVITGVYRQVSSGFVNIYGTLNSKPNTTYKIELYRGATPDPSGHGEGEILMSILNISVTTNASGNATFASGNLVGVGAPGSGEFVTATATDTTLSVGETSEFSNSFTTLPSYQVDTTSDDGTLTACTLGGANDCSLRGAINNVNAAGVKSAITFEIPGGGVRTIAPTSALPAITTPVAIDGYTNTGASVNTLATGDNAVPVVRLDGTSAGSTVRGLDITAGSSTVRGLIVTKFDGGGIITRTGGGNSILGCFIGTDGAASLGNRNGLQIGDANNLIGTSAAADRNIVSGNQQGLYVTGAGNVIRGNYVGTNLAGTAAIGNQFNGIYDLASGNTVGGTSTGDGNLVSGNGAGGIVIQSVANALVQGNVVGLNVSGTGALANGNSGVQVLASTGSTIGGTSAAARNIISGNGANGVQLDTGRNTVQGNYIGTDISGTLDLGNAGNGIRSSGDLDVIGGAGAARNVISGNGGAGVVVWGAATAGSCLIQNNLIGTTVSGTAALGNTGDGISVDLTASNLLVGGTTAGLGNVIANNGGAGIVQDNSSSGTGNQYLGNSIYNNGALGIDLGNTGVDTIDGLDSDTGPNDLQNAPQIGNVAFGGGLTVVNLLLASAPNTQYRIELFSSTAPDASGSGEGQVFRDAQTITTDANGDMTFGFSLPGTITDYFSATATRIAAPTDTSEFSNAMRAPQNFVVDNNGDAAGGACTTAANDCSLRSAIANANASAGTDTISFNIAGGGTRVISPATALPAITEAVIIDGYSQTGSSVNTSATASNAVPLIQINGGFAAFNGLTVSATGGGSTISGLIISNFNGVGIDLTGGGNTITGCFIGTDDAGTGNLGNDVGISSNTSGDIIGGTTAAARNVISGNTTNGIRAFNSTNVTIRGNLIGTDKTGLVAIANGSSGVFIRASSNITVGGNTATARNVISGNGAGINIIGPTPTNIIIQGNYIGTNVTGTAALGNVDGITLNNFGASSGITIGSAVGVTNAATLAANANIISFNTPGNGVSMGNGGNGVSVRGNSIYSNAALGLNIVGGSETQGITANDVNDADAGTNNIQNFPVISTAAASGGNTTITGTLNSVDSASYVVDLYRSPTANARGNGEGQTYIGSTTVTLPLSVNTGNFSLTVAGTFTGQFISGTATAADGSTSEFAATKAVTAAAVPTIASVAPTSGRRGSIVVITGTNFTGTTAVTFNGASTSRFTVDSATQITATVPAAATTGLVAVTNTNGTGTSATNYTVSALDYEVTNTADTGPGSLREAITKTNGNATAESIFFNIPGGGVHTITVPVGSALPIITDAVNLEGFNQPLSSANTATTGNNANPLIRLDGPGSTSSVVGLEIEAPNCTVRGLIITRFKEGVHFGPALATGNKVEGCFIGTDASDTTGLGNAVGVRLHAGANGNTIGGTAAAQRNVISGNGIGVQIHETGTTANTVSNCYIGTNKAGTAALANGTGVSLGTTGNTIGSTTANAGNLISGNTSRGISDVGDGSVNTTGNTIIGNTIGLNIGRTATVGNQDGIVISSRDKTSVGSLVGGRNYISGNTLTGISVFQNTAAAQGIVIQGNTIGSNGSGATNLGNGSDGIFMAGTGNSILSNGIQSNAGNGVQLSNATNILIQQNNIGSNTAGLGNTGSGVFLSNGAKNNAVGGIATDTNPQPEGNFIAGNAVGVNVFSGASDATGNSIRGNTIENNTGLGIDLRLTSQAANTPTLNDTGDADTGNNNLQNFPVINSIIGTTANVSLNSIANTTFAIDFYDNATADPSGYGEGSSGLGQTTATTDGTGNVTFNFTLTGVPAGVVSATATNQTTGDTSEFSLTAAPSTGLVVDTTSDANLTACTAAANDCSLRGAINRANAGAGADTISFNIPSAGVQIIAPATDLPTLTDNGTTIDGSTQPGYTGKPAIVIAPTGTNRTALAITGANNVIKALALNADLVNLSISGAGATNNTITVSHIGLNAAGTATVAAGTGVRISGGATLNKVGVAGAGNYIGGSNNGVLVTGAGTNGNLVAGNFIGVNGTGNAAAANGRGIWIQLGAKNNVLGGTAAGTGNLIAANTTAGIDIADNGTTGNLVQGNTIGLNTAGAALANNTGVLIESSASANTVGGSAAGAGNVISGNTNGGVTIQGAATNVVQANTIGTNAAGTAAMANGFGIAVNTGSTGNNIVGNLVSGNSGGGIGVNDAGTANTTVTGNIVGLNRAGTAAVPNDYGIGIFNGAKNNTIGGTSAALRNVASGNTNGGISIRDTGSTGNTILGNYAGLNTAGTAAVPNRYGIAIFNGATNNTIGGAAANTRNVASGNTEAGIGINDAGSSGNTIQNNYCGTNAAGTAALANNIGITVYNGATNNTVSTNLTSGNVQAGISISDANTANNLVQANTVGLGATGAALGNGPFAPGVTIFQGAHDNTIGGSIAARNIIGGNLGAGIKIDTANSNIVSSNYLGLNAAGTGAVGNSRGVTIDNGANNTIGGTTAADRNFFAANEFGVGISGANAKSNKVQGNYFGTDGNGNAASPNAFANDYCVGISGGASGNTIGGTATVAGDPPGNLLSGAVNSNILIDGATSNSIYGNLIGTTKAGNAPLGNFTTTAGVSIGGASTNNVVGSSTAGNRNIISGNAGNGVALGGAGTTGNVIEGNYIGVGIDGTTSVPNANEGIDVEDASNNTIGSIGAGNVIRNNKKNGVCIGGTATGNTIRGNSIDNNLALGIDLNEDGITANDDTAKDADTGPNNLQNYPTLTQTAVSATLITYRADLITNPGAQVIIDLYSSPAASASGNGEGRTLEGSSATLTANATTGAVTANFTVPVALIGQSFSATATNITTKDTSEFSVAKAASQMLTLTIAPAGFSEAAGPTAATATVKRSGPTTSALTITANSSDTTEATVPGPPTVISFAAGSDTVTFPIAAVNDAVTDGTQSSLITVSAPGFIDGTATVQVFDDEGAGFIITPSTGLTTTEAGGTATFTVALATAPLSPVTLPLSSSNTAEGTIVTPSPASLTFTPANFAAPQTVTIKGVDDLVDDGDVPYSIVTGAATSLDPAYNGRNPIDVAVTNTDDDTAGVVVTPTSGLITNESGGTATFTVRLNSKPTSGVSIALSSSRPLEGDVTSPASKSLTFTTVNYATPQTVTITGKNDSVVDGNQPYTIVLAKAVSGDAIYNAIDPADVSVINQDNDSAGISGLLAWGYNTYGQLGDGTTTHRSSPEVVTGFPSVAELAAGGGHSVTRGTAGPLSAAGYNAGGQLGDGTLIDKKTPVTVNGVAGVTSISTGWYHTLALDVNGRVWAWGDNGYGQLGDGTLTDRTTAVQVKNLTNVVAISGGVYHSAALKNDGTVWVWGNNFYGQLGDGTVNDSSVPVQAHGILGATAIAAGGAHTVALVGGSVYAWGWNDDGQLGDGTIAASGQPVKANGVSGATAISAGYAHTLAIIGGGGAGGGSVMAWGNNNYGQLGDGTTTGSRVPVLVRALTNAKLISAGAAHNLAIKSDGTLWAWGNNAYGSLGDGTTTNRSTPQLVPGVSTARAISAGYGHSLALGDTVAVIRVSPIVLSAITASVRDGAVTLSFTGPLDPATASNAANYGVTANGLPLNIKSASYSAATNTVTLKVDGLTIRAKVVASWRGLLTVDGKKISDSQGTTTAGK